MRQNSAAGTPSSTRWSHVRLSVSRLTVATVAVVDDHVVAQPADAEDPGVGRVDHRREGVDAEGAERADAERPALEVGGRDVAVAGGAARRVVSAARSAQVAVRRVADHGHQQAVVDGDGEADVDVGQQRDAGLGDLRVDARVERRAPRAVAATT